MKEEIYVLRLDMYNEWAWENGASSLMCVSYDINTIIKELKKYLEYEKQEDEDRIIDDVDTDINTTIKRVEERLIKGDSLISISIYENEYDFDNGKDNGVYVIEKMEIK